MHSMDAHSVDTHGMDIHDVDMQGVDVCKKPSLPFLPVLLFCEMPNLRDKWLIFLATVAQYTYLLTYVS
jgi:hypothetical protein